MNSSASVRVQKGGFILTFLLKISDIYPLLTAITPTILDVLDIFFGHKIARLGVNGNPDEQ